MKATAGLQAALVAVALALGFLAIAGPAGGGVVADPDVFWLAATGRDMVAHHAAPLANVYSYADANHPWVMHEPLFALLYYEGFSHVGPAVASLVGVLCATGVVLVAMGHLFGQCRSALAAGACGALVLACQQSLVAPRPGYASFVIVAAMVAVALRPGWSVPRAAGALLLELVWTNAHGSFSLGVVLLVAAAFDEGRSKTERRAWLATALAAALVTLVNPYGYRLHGLVGRYLHPDDPTARLIQENIRGFLPLWRGYSTGFANRSTLVALAVVLPLAASALVRRRHVARALVTGAAAAMGIYQIRNVALAVLLGGILLYPWVDDRVARWLVPPAGRPGGPPARGNAAALAFAVALPGLVAGVLTWRSTIQTREPNAWIGSNLGGAALVRLAHGVPDGTHLYAPFTPSAVVLWFEAARGVQVLFDPRNDCYSPDVARAGFQLGFTHLRPDIVLGTLDRFDTRYAIVPNKGPVVTALADDDGWVRYRRDHDWSAFRRREPDAPDAPAPASP